MPSVWSLNDLSTNDRVVSKWIAQTQTFPNKFFIIEVEIVDVKRVRHYHGLLLYGRRNFRLPSIWCCRKMSFAPSIYNILRVANNPIHMLNSLYLPTAVMLIILIIMYCNQSIMFRIVVTGFNQ